MFDNRRYITCGVIEEIPVEVQLVMWALLDSFKATGRKVDYLQVFQLSDENGQQKIVHIQEKPPYKSEVTQSFGLSKPVTAEIFVIDDGAQSTMLLAEEY